MGIRRFIERMSRRRHRGDNPPEVGKRARQVAREVASLRRANERSRPREGNPYGEAGTRGIEG
ncbi:hypothetical protein [Nocardia spumae]|uniref:hypothetical protein n=1 Tax=Nocardia spumae TaxID=2887190 RepID=UPI001D148596|nr:hypothetical protein [Nocardia spumae]